MLPLEEQWRAGTYSLLARLLGAPPDRPTLGVVVDADSDPVLASSSLTPLAVAWQDLAKAGRALDLEAVDDEYHDLFIGLGRGELVPFASWYRHGLLMEEPLVRLRQDLAELGFERQSQNRDPEDHIAALCEVMAILIWDGESLQRQESFFEEHLASWAERFFRDLQRAESADFYRAVGGLGAQFMALEQHQLTMAE